MVTVFATTIICLTACFVAVSIGATLTSIKEKEMEAAKELNQLQADTHLATQDRWAAIQKELLELRALMQND